MQIKDAWNKSLVSIHPASSGAVNRTITSDQGPAAVIMLSWENRTQPQDKWNVVPVSGMDSHRTLSG